MSFPSGMSRVALGLEYAGSEFHGFQRQTSTSNTVQAALEKALSAIGQEPISLVCAGRTDAGVHATGQVVHFDTLASRPNKAWVLGANTKLPDAVRIRWAHAQAPGFHARFSAQSRTYRYVFYTERIRSAVLGRRVSYPKFQLDFDTMSQASEALVGEHDFNAFRAAHCQARNPVRTIEYIRWSRCGSLIGMEIKANAFLHHMVRNIVGSLQEIGFGKQEKPWLQHVLNSKDRSLAGPTASPDGLYLVKVDYPEQFGLPNEPLGPAFFHWNDHSTL